MVDAIPPFGVLDTILGTSEFSVDKIDRLLSCQRRFVLPMFITTLIPSQEQDMMVTIVTVKARETFTVLLWCAWKR
jgi:hypothetical protein